MSFLWNRMPSWRGRRPDVASNIVGGLATAMVADSEARQMEALARSNPEAAARVMENRDKTNRVILYVFLGIFGAVGLIMIIAMARGTASIKTANAALSKQQRAEKNDSGDDDDNNSYY